MTGSPPRMSWSCSGVEEDFCDLVPICGDKTTVSMQRCFDRVPYSFAAMSHFVLRVRICDGWHDCELQEQVLRAVMATQVVSTGTSLLLCLFENVTRMLDLCGVTPHDPRVRSPDFRRALRVLDCALGDCSVHVNSKIREEVTDDFVIDIPCGLTFGFAGTLVFRQSKSGEIWEFPDEVMDLIHDGRLQLSYGFTVGYRVDGSPGIGAALLSNPVTRLFSLAPDLKMLFAWRLVWDGQFDGGSARPFSPIAARFILIGVAPVAPLLCKPPNLPRLVSTTLCRFDDSVVVIDLPEPRVVNRGRDHLYVFDCAGLDPEVAPNGSLTFNSVVRLDWAEPEEAKCVYVQCSIINICEKTLLTKQMFVLSLDTTVEFAPADLEMQVTLTQEECQDAHCFRLTETSFFQTWVKHK